MRRDRLQKPARLQEAMGLALKAIGIEMGPEELLIRACWKETLGERIAKVTKPDGLKRGRLFIVVEDPIWLHQLKMLSPQIIASLNERLKAPVVKEVYLRIGPLPHRGEKSPSPLRARPRLKKDEVERLLAKVQGFPWGEVIHRILKKAGEER